MYVSVSVLVPVSSPDTATHIRNFRSKYGNLSLYVALSFCYVTSALRICKQRVVSVHLSRSPTTRSNDT